MATYIDGIGASQNIDSSGECVLIEGLDISMLAQDGVFNYEHESATKVDGVQIKVPAQVVGKILEAKKIFSEKDCENDRHKYYWDKCKTPFLYVMGELFDDYTDAARDLAGKFRYDADKKGQNERNVVNFSVEGSKLDKRGMVVAKSIARKITITAMPCNKAAIAEMVPVAGKKPKDDLDGIFKTENSIEIELFKPAKELIFAELLKKEPMKKDDEVAMGVGASSPGLMASEPLAKADTSNVSGTKIGATASGKDVFSHGRVGNYTGFSSKDHTEASGMHMKAASGARDNKLVEHHMGKARLHMQAAGTAEKRENRAAHTPGARPKTPVHPSTTHLYTNIPGKRTPIAKAETAGGGDVAPSMLTGGAALAKEDLVKAAEKGVHIAPNANQPGNSFAGNLTRSKKFPEGIKAGHKAVLNTLRKMPKPNLTKSQNLARAEEAYQKWEKREEFESFMTKRLPGLAKGEIRAIGQTMALKKSIEAEKSLVKMANLKKTK